MLSCAQLQVGGRTQLVPAVRGWVGSSSNNRHRPPAHFTNTRHSNQNIPLLKPLQTSRSC